MPMFKCSHCGKDIEDNEPYFSVNLGKEKIDGGAITVIHEDSVKEFCLKCADL